MGLNPGQSWISPKNHGTLLPRISARTSKPPGLQDIVSLKDKSCMTGGEYVVPSKRIIFRVPSSIINLQAGSGLMETGWNSTVPGLDGPLLLPECTDGHVTKMRETSGGTVAQSHITEEDGPDAFNPKEVDPMCTDTYLSAFLVPFISLIILIMQLTSSSSFVSVAGLCLLYINQA